MQSATLTENAVVAVIVILLVILVAGLVRLWRLRYGNGHHSLSA